MKNLFALFTVLCAFSFASARDLEGAAVQFDAADLFFNGDYEDVQLLNKTGEKIELTVCAWSEKDDDWIRFGTVRASDYNETDTLSKTIRYKITPMDKFKKFAIVPSKTRLDVKFDLSAKDETVAIVARYAVEVRPLASLESKIVREKNGSGICAEFSFRNVSGKNIKNAELTFRASDKGMVVRNKSAGSEETTIRTKNLVRDGSRYKAQTSAFWTDFAIDEIKITRVKITFEDGTVSEYEP